MTQPPAPDLLGLLGHRIDDDTVLDVLAAVDPARTFRRDLGRWHWTSKRSGVGVGAEGYVKLITTVCHYADGVERFRRYAGPLPYGLDFTMSRPEVRARLPRPPDFTSIGRADPGADYDTWDLPGHRLVVRYRPGTGTVCRVAVTNDR